MHNPLSTTRLVASEHNAASGFGPTDGGQTTLSSRPLRVATYNIHKGVRGLGPAKRLEIHNLGLAVEALDADIVCLQEVRRFHHGEARHFSRTGFGNWAWPEQPQAEYLAPEGYEVAYRTNAYTRDGEHGNALLTRWKLGEVGHHDVSHHRFEQRGLLHVPVYWRDVAIHVVVCHFGLFHVSRVCQAERVAELVSTKIPADAPVIVAGDFNDWRLRAHHRLQQCARLIDSFASAGQPAPRTFPARWPVLRLDRIYARNVQVQGARVLSTRPWSHLSDHAPLCAEIRL